MASQSWQGSVTWHLGLCVTGCHGAGVVCFGCGCCYLTLHYRLIWMGLPHLLCDYFPSSLTVACLFARL